MNEPIRDPDCRVCFDCRGAHHHWMEDFDEDAEWEHSPEPMPVWACKHCEFTMPYCLDGFDSEEPDEMFAYLKLAEHDPARDEQTLPLFSDEVPHG